MVMRAATLTTSFVSDGPVGAAVAAFTTPGGSFTSGILLLTRVPSEATIEQAWLYGDERGHVLRLDGDYKASASGFGTDYGLGLVVAFRHPGLPVGRVVINDGAGEQSITIGLSGAVYEPRTAATIRSSATSCRSQNISACR